MVPLRQRPDPEARDLALVERGVIGTLQSCNAGWCELDIGALRGWLPVSALWGG